MSRNLVFTDRGCGIAEDARLAKSDPRLKRRPYLPILPLGPRLERHASLAEPSL
jgi:hypothetical protein